jgi:hypothetical protein
MDARVCSCLCQKRTFKVFRMWACLYKVTNVVTYETPNFQNMLENNLIPKWPTPGIMI